MRWRFTGAALLKMKRRVHATRGHANHGWLDTYHTFSFGMWFDRKYNGFRALRVINEDVIKPKKGFGTHSHRNYEIFSYILGGELTHRDSMGNVETLRRGDVQFTSAGSGISHSEHNEHHSEDAKILQIWVEPYKDGLQPSYQTKTFSEDAKRNALCLILSPSEEAVGARGARNGSTSEDTIKINQDVRVYASVLEEGKEVTLDVADGRGVHVHLVGMSGSAVPKLEVQGSNGGEHHVEQLAAGDGLFVENLTHLRFTGLSGRSEFLVFDLA